MQIRIGFDIARHRHLRPQHRKAVALRRRASHIPVAEHRAPRFECALCANDRVAAPCSTLLTPTGRARIGRACLRKGWRRSEEHTSELQSLMRISYAVFCLKKTI